MEIIIFLFSKNNLCNFTDFSLCIIIRIIKFRVFGGEGGGMKIQGSFKDVYYFFQGFVSIKNKLKSIFAIITELTAKLFPTRKTIRKNTEFLISNKKNSL